MSDDLIKRSDAIEAVSISCRTCLARDIEDCKKMLRPKVERTNKRHSIRRQTARVDSL